MPLSTPQQQKEYNARWLAKNPTYYADRKKANPWYFRERRAGLKAGDYVKMREAQSSRCELCGRHESELGYHGLVIDHDHRTGKVRALLCNPCNVALGWVEKHSLLPAFQEYLKRW